MLLFKHIIYFILFWVVQATTAVLANMEQINQTTAFLINSTIMISVGILFYHQLLKTQWQYLKATKTVRHVFKLSFILFFINVAVRYILVILLNNFIDFDTFGQNQQYLNEQQTMVNPLIFILATVISAPFVEELMFREIWNGWIKFDNKLLRGFMAVISTLLFAAAHVLSLQDFILYLPLSISLIWIYYRFNRNIWASIIFHFVNNGIAVGLMYLAQSLPQDMLEQATSGIIQLLQ